MQNKIKIGTKQLNPIRNRYLDRSKEGGGEQPKRHSDWGETNLGAVKGERVESAGQLTFPEALNHKRLPEERSPTPVILIKVGWRSGLLTGDIWDSLGLSHCCCFK